jgi:hypothetical protein
VRGQRAKRMEQYREGRSTTAAATCLSPALIEAFVQRTARGE